MKNVLISALIVSASLATSILFLAGYDVCRQGRAARAAVTATANGDTNGDGERDISDAVRLLEWLFQGGPAPVALASSGCCVASVRDFGATPNDGTDDTDAIQAAVDASGIVCVPDGTYLIDPAVSISLRSQQTLIMSRAATLKALTSSARVSSVLKIWDRSNVTIIGGTVEGDRATHMAEDTFGIGIDIRGSRDVTVMDTVAKDFWSDGFYIGPTGTSSEGIRLVGCLGDNNRRQGLSVTGCKGALIQGCTFRNTHGTEPEGGIDLEPNHGDTVEEISIVACRIHDNRGRGILVNRGSQRCVVTKNHVFQNVLASRVGEAAIWLEATTENNLVEGNLVFHNRQHGILVAGTRHVITGNNVDGNAPEEMPGPPPAAGDGIRIMGSGHLVTGNTVRRNGCHGIRMVLANDCTVSGNYLSENSQLVDGLYSNLYLEGNSVNNTVQGNTCRQGSSARRPAFGIVVNDSVVNDTVVHLNDVRGGGVSGNLMDTATGTMLFKNAGYASEAGGSTVVADGDTINHGLAKKPTSVLVTPTVPGELVSVTAVTATSLTVALRKPDGSPGTQQAVFWKAEL